MMSEFFAMGGHALYVWPSFGFFLLVIIINWLSPVLAGRALKRDLARGLRRAERRQ